MQNIHWLPLFFDEAVAGLVPGRGGISPWRTDTRGKLVIRSLSERPAIMGTKNINIKSKPQSTSYHSMHEDNNFSNRCGISPAFCVVGQRDPNIWCFIDTCFHNQAIAKSGDRTACHWIDQGEIRCVCDQIFQVTNTSLLLSRFSLLHHIFIG